MKVWHGNCFINLCMQVRLGYFKNKDKYVMKVNLIKTAVIGALMLPITF